MSFHIFPFNPVSNQSYPSSVLISFNTPTHSRAALPTQQTTLSLPPPLSTSTTKKTAPHNPNYFHAARHVSPTTFYHKDLRDSTHVFLRQDATRRALEPQYIGPHEVIDRTDKTQLLRAAGRSIYQRTE